MNTTSSMHDQLRKPAPKNLNRFNKPKVDRLSYRLMSALAAVMAIVSLAVLLTSAKEVNAMTSAKKAEAVKADVKNDGYDSKYLLSPEIISYREMRRYGKVSDIGHAE